MFDFVTCHSTVCQLSYTIQRKSHAELDQLHISTLAANRVQWWCSNSDDKPYLDHNQHMDGYDSRICLRVEIDTLTLPGSDYKRRHDRHQLTLCNQVWSRCSRLVPVGLEVRQSKEWNWTNMTNDGIRFRLRHYLTLSLRKSTVDPIVTMAHLWTTTQMCCHEAKWCKCIGRWWMDHFH